MKSGGGVAVHSAVARRPVDLVLSGPAGGVAAAVALSRKSPSRNLVTFDMGGTSADFSALQRGEPTWTTDAVIDTFPIAIPVIDIESVGAGGGSLAWIDAGGALRVGPESAGATPGPMAYGAGGSQVTVTDADLVGGSLGPSLLGGRLPLDKSLATKGIEALASTLHLSRDEAILGVQRVVEASMAKAMRLVLARRLTIQRSELRNQRSDSRRLEAGVPSSASDSVRIRLPKGSNRGGHGPSRGPHATSVPPPACATSSRVASAESSGSVRRRMA